MFMVPNLCLLKNVYYMYNKLVSDEMNVRLEVSKKIYRYITYL